MSNTKKQDVALSSGLRTLEGEVVSDKMHKTVVVEVTRSVKHQLLGKVIKKSKKFKVHDEQEAAHVGDLVEIVECRPISKTKHMRLSKILRSANEGLVV